MLQEVTELLIKWGYKPPMRLNRSYHLIAVGLTLVSNAIKNANVI
jgi:hypothetical protein